MLEPLAIQPEQKVEGPGLRIGIPTNICHTHQPGCLAILKV